MSRSVGSTIFWIGFVIGCLLIFSETLGIVGYLVAFTVLPFIGVTVAFFFGPLAWLVLFLVIPLAALVNGLMVGIIAWGSYKLFTLINH